MSEKNNPFKSVKDILGETFYIPNYQRGYRWGEQEAMDLMEDIYSFCLKHKGIANEIYCVQPLVVSRRTDDTGFNVVDGQQRLTTLFLLLTCLEVEKKYNIDYCTRAGSREFLNEIKTKAREKAKEYIEYYCMFSVYNVINKWLEEKDFKEIGSKSAFTNIVLDKVCFIWYEVKESDEVATFTRLNIGKIPLTDSELIRALFLNRTSFDSTDDRDAFDTLLQHIALEWDQIEKSLQSDEFWAFLHSLDYAKPTRIDFILDAIADKDEYNLCKEYKNLRSKKSQNAIAYNKDLNAKIGNDSHRTFRYFYEAFKRNEKGIEGVREFWACVEEYYLIFKEWYNDYRMYHYIGYLTCSSSGCDILSLVSLWRGKTKEDFISELRNKIVGILKKKSWITEVYSYKFDEVNNESKRECVDILLLHNIETIIKQNEELVRASKYNLPNFSKFPFHIFKREKWQVEHIRPNAGNDFSGAGNKKLYLSLAMKYVSDELVKKEIEKYLGEESPSEDEFQSCIEKILEKSGALPEEDKNRIWNYVLLDETTNKEYGNQIFPVKRMYIRNKENGIKIKYAFEKGELKEKSKVEEVAFVPPCTKNVFSKFYTNIPATMTDWNLEDAKAYWEDMTEKLSYYFDKVGVKKTNE